MAVALGQSEKLERLILHERYYENIADTIRSLRLLVMTERPTDGQIALAVQKLGCVGYQMSKIATDVPMTQAVISRS